MKIINKTEEMRDFSSEIRKTGKRLGFVPTMGFLHEGHISLAKIAMDNSDVVVLSNFVNPTQFGPNEDFEKYPRDIERDNNLCEKAAIHAVFAPKTSEIYSANESVWVYEDKLSSVLCGSSRPGHFKGVCTVVAKLFNIVAPDVAIFGQKDYQQLKIIRKMVEDLKFSVNIIQGPIIRESDGLAMSSRNKYLSVDERKNATAIFASLKDAEKKILAGIFEKETLINDINLRISQANGKIDYIEILDAETLQTFDINSPPKKFLIAVAAFFGKTRLIDNMLVDIPFKA